MSDTHDTAGMATCNSESPYWQTGPCPEWCGTYHRDGDDPDSRLHLSTWESRILATLYPTLEKRYPEYREPLIWEPELIVYLQQHVREAEPRVVVDSEARRDDLPTVELTLAEATALGRALLAASEIGGVR